MRLIAVRRNRTALLRNLAVVLLVLANVYTIGSFIFGRSKVGVDVVVANETDVKPYMGCHDFRHTRAFALGLHGSISITTCRNRCKERDSLYAVLQGGNNCLCSSLGGQGIVRLDSACSMPCAGNATERCGSVRSASVYAVRVPDGGAEWTQWMTLEESGDMRRFKGCNRRRLMSSRDGDSARVMQSTLQATFTCSMSVERRGVVVSSGGGQKWSAPFGDRFVGCFTPGSFAAAPAAELTASLPQAIEQCLQLCTAAGQAVATVSKLSDTQRACRCASSLGSSLSLDTCSSGYGALVFSTRPMVNNTFKLQFDVDRPQKKILLLGYFRGGTTFASSLLNRYKSAFYTYEPDSVLGVKWKGIDSFGSATAMNDVLAEMVLDRYFRCDMYRIPGYFFSWYPDWGEDNTGFDAFEECKRVFASTGNAPSKCIPVLEESCRRSDLVVAKTTRFLAPSSVEAFIRRNPDVHVVHLVRDPRGTLASRQRVSAYFREDVEHHSRVLCKEILAINDLFSHLQSDFSVHTVHYEDLAVTPMKAAEELYRKLGLPFLQQMKDHILSVTASNATRIRNYYFSIQRPDAAKHATSWKHHFKKEVIKAIDQECHPLYDAFKSHYGRYLPSSDEGS